MSPRDNLNLFLLLIKEYFIRHAVVTTRVSHSADESRHQKHVQVSVSSVNYRNDMNNVRFNELWMYAWVMMCARICYANSFHVLISRRCGGGADVTRQDAARSTGT